MVRGCYSIEDVAAADAMQLRLVCVSCAASKSSWDPGLLAEALVLLLAAANHFQPRQLAPQTLSYKFYAWLPAGWLKVLVSVAFRFAKVPAVTFQCF